MKITLASMGVAPEAVAQLAAIGGNKIAVTNDDSATVAALAEADGLIISDSCFTPAIADAVRGAKHLRWLQFLNAGYDNATRLELVQVPTDPTR